VTLEDLPRVTIALLLCAAPFVAAAAPAGDPDPGVSLDLAEARAARISNLRYDLALSIPSDRAARIEGRVTIAFELADAEAPLVLDFAAPPDHVREVRAEGRPVAARLVNGHIVVPASVLARGGNQLTIEFTAGDAPLNRADDFLYSVFVPARAHEALPCFDQPDLKGRWTVTLDVPAGWEALANGAERARETVGDRVRVGFTETKPISTYLVAVAAGRMQVETAERDGRTLRMFHRETDAARLERNRDVIFDLHAHALAWMERYTGIPYPWGSFAFFLAPAFQFGGMEHPGAITYNAPVLLLEPSATKNQLLGRASLIAHETAHMWFGDLVTMRWFDDVWMKEVFANFMAAKIVNPSFPEIDHDLRFLYAHYPVAYDVDRTAGTHPIRQPLENLRDAGTLYGPIIYQKAPIVMRQLERLLGEDALRDGLREYLHRFAYGNASWSDLIGLLDRRTDEDLAGWSRVWVESSARPTIRTELELDAGGRIASLALVQDDPLGRGLRWPQRLQLALGTAEGVRHVAVMVRDTRTVVDEVRGWAAPDFVLPNGGGLGYGLFLPDHRSLAWLAARAGEIPDGLTRGSAYVTLWDQVLEGRLAPADFLELALRALPDEADELNVQRLLAQAERLYWRFTDAGRRAALAPRVEGMLREGLAHAPTSGLKNAWFRSVSRTALTGATLDFVAAVWRQDHVIEGLELGEPDYIALAQELAVRNVQGWEAMLDRQLARIGNPDRRARFTFVRPAVSADPAVRDAFFASLADPANRQREAWVLEALEYLHHPLRAAESQRYVRPSLELLETIQRTGDIFFPKRWMDATLGGHASAAVADTVRAFLAERPDYPPRLRRIILQSADELFRVAR
jgi:aminopeptidase N